MWNGYIFDIFPYASFAAKWLNDSKWDIFNIWVKTHGHEVKNSFEFAKYPSYPCRINRSENLNWPHTSQSHQPFSHLTHRLTWSWRRVGASSSQSSTSRVLFCKILIFTILQLKPIKILWHRQERRHDAISTSSKWKWG